MDASYNELCKLGSTYGIIIVKPHRLKLQSNDDKMIL